MLPSGAVGKMTTIMLERVFAIKLRKATFSEKDDRVVRHLCHLPYTSLPHLRRYKQIEDFLSLKLPKECKVVTLLTL